MSTEITETVGLTEKIKEKIDMWVAKFPVGKHRSAIIGSLHAAQEHNQGYLTPELMDAVADYLDLPRIYVYEVATFYSMFQTEPVGRNEIAICTNISCMLSGSDVIVQHIEDRLNIKLGESTKDGNIFLKKEEECLAACTRAPMMMVNHQYIENLNIKKVNEILDKLEQ
jgi:NADH-quinone oxidoreductase subunit E|tara:strand:+ start:156 stop:662 length:507 start_codon:yes stop_codon:yes gene_type:complete